MKTNASILVKGVKQRFYFNDTVFLPNDTIFEIEFFNKSQRTVCPSVTINGEKLISSPVIYNGQKYVLYDFIDDKRRFLFKVYEVASNDEDVKMAIKDNGVISIKYFYESLIKKTIIEASPIVEPLNEYSEIQFSIDLSQELSDEISQPIETGKIIKGTPSGVKYKTVEIELDYNDSETQIIKLLPLSKKPKFINCPKCSNSSKIDANYCEVCGHQYFST
jgi:hypothetical protein